MSDTMGLGTVPPAAPAAPYADLGGPKPNLMERDTPDPDPARAKLVKQMQAAVVREKKHWGPTFKQMRLNAQRARQGGSKEWVKAGLYVANITGRHVRAQVAGLYAKNPTIKAEARRTLDFKVWDEAPETLQAAAMDPAANMELLQDVIQGTLRRKMLSGVAKTMQVLATHQISNGSPPFKVRMKAVVKRAVIAGVGYVRLGYERQMQPAPNTVTQTSQLAARVANIERLKADLADDDEPTDEQDAEAEQLRLAMAELQAAPQIVTHEGVRFDFPLSTSIIPDEKLEDIRGFIGCDYVTEEYLWTCDQVQELFGVDIDGAGTKFYRPGQDGTMERLPDTVGESQSDGDENRQVCVWERYSRKDGLVYWLVDGYPDFLSEPAPPVVTLNRFWPWFALALNQTDYEEFPFPVSDVQLLEHQQDEWNRNRQGLRDHRIASRPKYATPRGTLTDDDKAALTTADAHAVVELDGVREGQKVEDVLQLVKHAGVDLNLYDTSPTEKDMKFAGGMQAADMGATSGDTATETSVAANAHAADTGSNIDDLDSLLSEMFREMGHVLMLNMGIVTVTKIVGPGATWPQLAIEDVMADVSLDIDAGSSGRPNKQAEIQAFERMAPILMQIPGIKPLWLAKEAIKRLGDNLDPTAAILEGIPSIMAMAKISGNAAPGQLPGDPPPGGPGQPAPTPGGAASQPGAQGAAGADNTPRPPGAVQQPPAMPAPGSGMEVMGRG